MECRAREVRQYSVPDRQSNRRLADTADAHDCNQAFIRLEQTPNLKHDIVATDHAAQRGRQVGLSRERVSFRGVPRDRSDEAVALALNVRDILVSKLAVAQCLA